MLDHECPTMRMVRECGFTERNCFGTDIFPLHFELNTDYKKNPFDVFGEFEWLFIEKRLPNFLRLGGDILLVFGEVAFKTLDSCLTLDLERLGRDNNHLSVYTELVSLIQSVR
jgi:hypothetical protein